MPTAVSPPASTNRSNSPPNVPVCQKFSGCHCTPTQNAAPGRSIASTTPSGDTADDTNARRHPADRLVMPAVDVARVERRRGAERRGEARARRHAHRVRDVILGHVDGVSELGRHRARDVLDQRASGGDVEHLHAAADREHRHVARDGGARERDLEAIARRSASVVGCGVSP